MSSITRQNTNKVLGLVEEGVIDRDQLILACLNYMSEADVADMCHAEYYELFNEDEDEDEDVGARLYSYEGAKEPGVYPVDPSDPDANES